jgi:hypothetical protein
MNSAAQNPTTIQIGRHSFTVELGNPERDGATRYVLRKVGGRGLTYETMRNANRPGLMFLVNPNASKLPNLWLSDEGGTLRHVEVA